MISMERRHTADFTSSHSTADAQTDYMLERAYRNIYGASLPRDEAYVRPLHYAARQLMRDPRARSLTARELLSVIEDMIRISDEHHERARKHLARASNPVYLRETALDKALEDRRYHEALTEILPGTKMKAKDEGRLQSHRPQTKMTSAEMMELAYQQLALTPSAGN
jgi:hypothetical protein